LDEELDLQQIIRVLRRRWWVIALFFLISTVTAFFVTAGMTPIYESTASILISTEGGEGIDQIFGFTGGLSRNAIQNYVEILRSQSLARQVIDRLGLEIPFPSAEFNSFCKGLNIQQVQNSDVVRISVQSEDRFLAKEIANTVVDIFEEQTHLGKQESARAAREFISGQLAIVAENLREAEEALLTFKEQEKIVSPREENLARVDKVVRLETLAAETRIALENTNARLDQLRRSYESASDTIVSSQTIVGNPLVQEYRSRMGQLETELAGAREKYTENHPTVLTLNAEITDLQVRLEQEVARIVGSETRSVNPVYQDILRNIVTLETEMMGLTAKEAALEEIIRESELETADLPHKELELLRLTRNQEVAQELYLLLVTKQEEIRIQEAMKVAGIQRIDPAVVSEEHKPVKPNKRLNVAVAGVLGIFAGVFLVFLREFLDTTLKTPQEVEELLGLPVLGQIPRIEEEKRRRKHKSRRGNRHSLS